MAGDGNDDSEKGNNNDDKTNKRHATSSKSDGRTGRKRQRPFRFGQSDDILNKDHYFDDDESSSNSIKEPIDISMDGNESDASYVDESRAASNTDRIQICRMEAKLDDLGDIIKQIQRMVISITNGSSAVADDSIIPDLLLPLKSMNLVNKFESDLANSASLRQKVIDHLCTINGTNGNKDGGKIVRSVVYATICPTVLQLYTWTGASKQDDKNGFRQYTQIVGVIFTVIHAYDRKYSRSECDDDFKLRIFKHVKKKAEKISGSLPSISSSQQTVKQSQQSPDMPPSLQQSQTQQPEMTHLLPPGPMPPAAISTRPMPPSQNPPSEMPPGPMPPAATSTGQMPHGQMPPGQVPYAPMHASQFSYQPNNQHYPMNHHYYNHY